MEYLMTFSIKLVAIRHFQHFKERLPPEQRCR